MNLGKTVFAQVIDFLPKRQFRRCVERYKGNYRVRSFTCFDQFLCMAFAQLTYRESLRDIECCLRAMKDKCYHAGIRGNISRSTIADANEKRNWRIYRDFAHTLIRHARQLYAGEDFGVQLDQTVYALDATIIDLVYRCSHGQSSESPKGLSNYTRFLICAGPYLHLCPSPMERFMRSISLTVLFLKSARFTSWTVAIWTLNDFLLLTKHQHSLSFVLNQIPA